MTNEIHRESPEERAHGEVPLRLRDIALAEQAVEDAFRCNGRELAAVPDGASERWELEDRLLRDLERARAQFARSVESFQEALQRVPFDAAAREEAARVQHQAVAAYTLALTRFKDLIFYSPQEARPPATPNP